MGIRRPGAGTLLPAVERGSRQVAAVEDSRRGLLLEEEAVHSHREAVDRILQGEADHSRDTPCLIFFELKSEINFRG